MTKSDTNSRHVIAQSRAEEVLFIVKATFRYEASMTVAKLML